MTDVMEMRGEYGERRLAHRPTPEIEELIRLQPELLDERNQGVCRNTEKLFIYSLLAGIRQNKKEFSHYFSHRKLPVPLAVREPFILPAVEMQVQINPGIFETINEVPAVMKRRLGVKIGVIPIGPCAGLELLFKDSLPATESHELYKGEVYKIWTDDSVYPDPCEYSFSMRDIEPYVHDYEFLRDEMKLMLTNMHTKWLNDHPEMKMRREHFWYLCQMHGIPIDTDRFHFTIPVI